MAEIVNLFDKSAVKEEQPTKTAKEMVIATIKAAAEAVEKGEIDPEMVYVAFKTVPDARGITKYSYFSTVHRTIELTGLLYQHLTRTSR